MRGWQPQINRQANTLRGAIYQLQVGNGSGNVCVQNNKKICFLSYDSRINLTLWQRWSLLYLKHKDYFYLPRITTISAPVITCIISHADKQGTKGRCSFCWICLALSLIISFACMENLRQLSGRHWYRHPGIHYPDMDVALLTKQEKDKNQWSWMCKSSIIQTMIAVCLFYDAKQQKQIKLRRICCVGCFCLSATAK